MLIEIRDINQHSFKISVKLSDTISQVKEKIKSKIEVLDVDDQKLVYSGNILANDSTMEQCDFEPSDYVTLLYNSTKKDEIHAMVEKAQKEQSSSCTADSRNTSEEFSIDSDQFNDSVDSESDDLSRALLESIPDVKKLCKLISNDPVELPKLLKKMSLNGPSVFENILENQHAYIDLLSTYEQSSDDKEIRMLETKDYEAIDRFMKKGYEKEIILEVYQACDFNENVATELLNYLR